MGYSDINRLLTMILERKMIGASRDIFYGCMATMVIIGDFAQLEAAGVSPILLHQGNTHMSLSTPLTARREPCTTHMAFGMSYDKVILAGPNWASPGWACMKVPQAAHPNIENMEWVEAVNIENMEREEKRRIENMEWAEVVV